VYVVFACCLTCCAGVIVTPSDIIAAAAMQNSLKETVYTTNIVNNLQTLHSVLSVLGDLAPTAEDMNMEVSLTKEQLDAIHDQTVCFSFSFFLFLLCPNKLLILYRTIYFKAKPIQQSQTGHLRISIGYIVACLRQILHICKMRKASSNQVRAQPATRYYR
jgi:hypothetical protein